MILNIKKENIENMFKEIKEKNIRERNYIRKLMSQYANNVVKAEYSSSVEEDKKIRETSEEIIQKIFKITGV